MNGNQSGNGETRALIRAIRIINRTLQDPDKMDEALQKIEEAVGFDDEDEED